MFADPGRAFEQLKTFQLAAASNSSRFRRAGGRTQPTRRGRTFAPEAFSHGMWMHPRKRRCTVAGAHRDRSRFGYEWSQNATPGSRDRPCDCHIPLVGISRCCWLTKHPRELACCLFVRKVFLGAAVPFLLESPARTRHLHARREALRG